MDTDTGEVLSEVLTRIERYSHIVTPMIRADMPVPFQQVCFFNHRRVLELHAAARIKKDIERTGKPMPDLRQLQDDELKDYLRDGR